MVTENKSEVDPDLAEFGVGSAGCCKIGKAITGLSEDDKRKITKALAHPDVSVRSIVEFLAKRDYSVGETTVTRHRRGHNKGH